MSSKNTEVTHFSTPGQCSRRRGWQHCWSVCTPGCEHQGRTGSIASCTPPMSWSFHNQRDQEQGMESGGGGGGGEGGRKEGRKGG